MPTFTRLPALPEGTLTAFVDVSSYDASSEVRNQIHPIVSRADVEATLRPAGLRTGSMLLRFTSRAAAHRAAAAHREVGVWTYTDELIPEASMSYVAQGSIRITLDDSRKWWAVAIGFQEVLL